MALDVGFGARKAPGLVPWLVVNKEQRETSPLSAFEDKSAAAKVRFPDIARFESDVADITEDGGAKPSGTMLVVALGAPASTSLPSRHLLLPPSRMLPLPRW